MRARSALAVCPSSNRGHGISSSGKDPRSRVPVSAFKITLAYDGTNLVGWQRQASGASIQGLLEDALRDLDEREVTVVGAGRTDAGVHASGQAASFSLVRSIDGDALVR